MAPKKKTPAALFADSLIQQKPHLVYYREDFFQFNGRYYERLQVGQQAHEVSDAVVQTLGPAAASSRYTNEIVDVLRQRQWISPELEPPFCRSGQPAENAFVVSNGVVLVDRYIEGRSDFLVPHHPDVFVTHGVDFQHDPAATCPLWTTWLDWFTGGDRGIHDLLQDFAGWCLLPDLRLENFIWMRGNGRNGKSTFADRMRYVFGGAPAVSSLSLSQLRSSGFEIAGTVGKRLNIVEEVRKKESVDEATLKRFTSQQIFTLNRKFREVMDARPTARLLVISNEFPFLADASDGLWRRLRVINCDATFEGPDDIGLGKRLDAEASGIFRWLLFGAKRVFENQQLTTPPVVLNAVIAERLKANPVELFLEDEFEITGQLEHWLPDRVLFENYGEWCERYRYKGSQSFGTFKEVLKRKFKRLTRKRLRWIGEREYGYVGIKRRVEPQEEENVDTEDELDPKLIQELMEW